MDSPTFTPTAEQIDAVHEWQHRQSRDRISRPLIPHLRERFDIDNAQALAVLHAANQRSERSH